MKPQTVQNVASVSKLVTATMIAQLAERNALQLNDSVEKFTDFRVRNPAFPDDEITVLQLLTHTSSIRDIRAERRAAYSCGPRRSELSDFMREYFQKTRVDGVPFTEDPPGTSYRYSNFGYALAGVIAESVSGESFEELCRAQVFAPLEMERSSWSFTDSGPNERATHYMWVDDEADLKEIGSSGLEPFLDPPHSVTVQEIRTQIPFCNYSDEVAPASLLWTSAADFARFLPLFLGTGRPTVLGIEMIQQMLSAHKTLQTRSGPFTQGLAWVREPRADDRTIWTSSGDAPGVSTVVQIEPESGNGIVLFANSESVHVGLRAMATRFFAGELLP